MDDQDAKIVAAKQRIITHMNNDHHDSIIRYLEHYHGLSSWTAYSGKISDITLDNVTLSAGDSKHVYQFQPPMTSFRDARERLVDMDKECVAALDRSDITIKEWQFPQGWHQVLFVVVLTTLIAFSSRSNFGVKGIFSPFLPDFFRRFCYRIQPFVWYGMIVIHGAETVNMARGRLRRHNVNIRSTTYWAWLGFAFIEGMGSYMRFDKMVRQKRAEKDRQKH